MNPASFRVSNWEPWRQIFVSIALCWSLELGQRTLTICRAGFFSREMRLVKPWHKLRQHSIVRPTLQITGYSSALFETVNTMLVSMQHMNSEKDMCSKYALFITLINCFQSGNANNEQGIRNFAHRSTDARESYLFLSAHPHCCNQWILGSSKGIGNAPLVPKSKIKCTSHIPCSGYEIKPLFSPFFRCPGYYFNLFCAYKSSRDRNGVLA